MNNIDKLYEELTTAFVEYQHRLENPFPCVFDIEEAIKRYRNDVAFHYKVQSLVNGVMNIVKKYV